MGTVVLGDQWSFLMAGATPNHPVVMDDHFVKRFWGYLHFEKPPYLCIYICEYCASTIYKFYRDHIPLENSRSASRHGLDAVSETDARWCGTPWPSRGLRGIPMIYFAGYWLVIGGLEPWNFMAFHIGNVIIIPTDELIFFRGVEITNQDIYTSGLWHFTGM